MASYKRNLIIIIIVISFILISSIESRYRDKDRKRVEKNGHGYTSAASTSESTVNICARDRDMKLLCYCSPSPEDFVNVPITKADCWIFHKDLHINDTIWYGLYQQKSLKHLKLTVQETGHIDYIPTKYFEILTNLTTINIEYSQILVIKSYAFGNLPNLEMISLNHNQIEIIENDGFANHIKLKELNLIQNQLSDIDRQAFRNLPELRKLFLSKNNVSNLHDEIFSNLGKLIELHLDHNLISVLTRDMFKGLGNLKSLKLTKNNLNFIGDTVFAELWSLQELELDENRLERISERALDGLNNLKTLNLRNNILKKLDNGLLRGVPALLSINLQENLLETLTFLNVQPIMDNLVNSTSELLISENKITCDCRLLWIFELRNRTRNQNLRNSLEEIECILYGDIAPSTYTNNDIITMNTMRSNHNGMIRQTNVGTKHITGNGRSTAARGTVSGGGGGMMDLETEYYDDEAPYILDVTKANGQYIELFKIKPEGLPCSEDVSDPTELPLSRESIGMDVRAPNQSSSCKLYIISIAKILTIVSLFYQITSFSLTL